MAEVHTYTVTEMNHLIKNLVEGSGLVANVQVRGEISNFKRYPSGHCYFSLKDENGVLKCVMFQRQARQLIKYPVNCHVPASGPATDKISCQRRHCFGHRSYRHL